MPRIYVLDKAVAELIAAGEVVERPASIVKELMENSIDAGATQLTVEIQGGGIRLIRVADNGCGIEREDIPRAFIRHATSKVRSAEDLDGILTLGFRGEALASIAAMCRVELTTRTAGDPEGMTCRVEGGETLEICPAGCPVGTAITVRDVFYNTPARMKFLKKDVSEGNAVAQAVEKCALAHPSVAFRFVRDGVTKLRTSGSGDQLAVIRAIYGKELADAMLPVEYDYDNKIRVTGYVSHPNGAKPSRAYQNFFINSRYVRTRTAAAALEEAFKNKLMGGKFPACALNLELAAQAVDVNVHPAKIEVRFSDEKPVYQAVYFAVRTALNRLSAPLESPPKPAAAKVNPITMHHRDPEPVQQTMTAREFRQLFDAKPAAPAVPAVRQKLSMQSSRLDIAVDDSPPAADIPLPDAPAPAACAEPIPEPEPEPLPEPNPYRLIGELFSTYILLEQDDDLVIVDKHAAHERILYEQLRENLAYGNRQVLLTPQAVTLAREEYDALLTGLDRVQAMGFTLEDFGEGTVLVREAPIELGERDIVACLIEIAGRLTSGNQDLTPETLDRLYYNIACRSAVKGGDRNHALELADIVERLRRHPEITHCPHGRPVAVRLSRHEVEKRFGRLV